MLGARIDAVFGIDDADDLGIAVFFVQFFEIVGDALHHEVGDVLAGIHFPAQNRLVVFEGGGQVVGEPVGCAVEVIVEAEEAIIGRFNLGFSVEDDIKVADGAIVAVDVDQVLLPRRGVFEVELDRIEGLRIGTGPVAVMLRIAIVRFDEEGLESGGGIAAVAGNDETAAAADKC